MRGNLTIDISAASPGALLALGFFACLLLFGLWVFFHVLFQEGEQTSDDEKAKRREERKRKKEEAERLKQQQEEQKRAEEAELQKKEAERREEAEREAIKQNEKKKMLEKLERIKGRVGTEIDENTILIGEEKAPAGGVALGWLIGEEGGKPPRKTIELEIIKEREREEHFYIVGGSGRGKTKLIEYLVRQDIERGAGFAVIDPHGDLIDSLKIFLTRKWGPQSRPGQEQGIEESEETKRLASDVVLIDPTDLEKTASFNPLELIPGADPVKLATGLTETFKKIWEGSSWGPRLEDLLRNSLVALSEGGLTLADLPDFLDNDDFRERVLGRVKNEIALSALRSFGEQSRAAKITATAPVLNKIRGVLIDKQIRQFFSQPKSTFNLREIMDGRKILLVSLPKGELAGVGELLGSVMMSSLQHAAFSRTNIKDREDRVPFFLYIDEFQNFATDSFLSVLSEALKYKLFLTLSHQNLSQLQERLQSSILGNCKVQIYFKLNYKDAEILAHQSGEKLIKERYTIEQQQFHRELHGEDFVESMKKYNPHIYHQPYELIGEAWGDRRQQLQDLKPRRYIVKIGEEGALLVDAEKILDPVDVFPKRELDLLRKRADAIVGSAHMRRREDLESETQAPSAGRRELAEPESFFLSVKPGDDI